MISQLRGTVVALSSNACVLDVAGVGYAVSITPGTALEQRIGQQVMLHTALIVREDAFLLYGFAALEELAVFDLLRSVTGVGPKSALSIIGSLGVEEISNAVAAEDDAAFKSVTGIGPKTAKLIVVTLAGKLAKRSDGTDQELMSALTGLGYSESVAKAALKAAQGQTKQEQLKSALAHIAKNRG